MDMGARPPTTQAPTTTVGRVDVLGGEEALEYRLLNPDAMGTAQSPSSVL